MPTGISVNGKVSATPNYGIGTFKVIGQNKPSITAWDRVTGRAKFMPDVYLPNMLYAMTIVSPSPKFVINSVDATAAEALPGVRLVMTPFNFPNAFLDGGKVGYYAGEEVACVVADTEEICETAIDLVKIDYTFDKNFVLSLEQAKDPAAPVVFAGAKSNVYITAQPFWSEKNAAGLWAKRVSGDYGGYGDYAAGFAQSDVIVEAKNLHYSMEKNPCPGDRGIVADYMGVNAVNKKMFVYHKSKGLSDDRTRWAGVLQVPASQMECIAPYSGGAWGMAGSMNSGAGETKGGEMAIFASQALLRPVRLLYTQNREMVQSWSKYSMANIKIGFKKDGTMVSSDHEDSVESGSYPSSSVGSSNRCGALLAYNRTSVAARIHTYRVASNRLKQRDFVGIGTAPSNFHWEVAMDMAAEKLGIDPIKLKQMNTMKKGSFEGTSGSPLAFVSSEGHNESLDAVAKRMNWATNWKAPSTKTGVVRTGLGAAIKTHTGGSWAGSSMIVKMYRDGSVELTTSLGDTGQGEPTAQVQIAAEVLGVPYEKCTMTRGTSHEPYAITLGGSTGTWNTGFSTWEAAQNLRDQVLGLGGTLFTPAITDLTLLDMNESGVFLKSDPTKKFTYTQVYAKIPVSSCTELVGYSYRRAPNGSCVPKETGASCASVDVDTETGMIFNVKVAAAAQAGRVMNPQIQKNQCNMGAVKGAHCALITDNVTDIPTGKNLTYNWIYYAYPTILEYECTMDNVELYGDESHPFGCKANSEGSPNPHAAAVANAVYNAIGVRMTSLPITPAKILKALGKI